LKKIPIWHECAELGFFPSAISSKQCMWVFRAWIRLRQELSMGSCCPNSLFA
jgi:hypothetical protein